MTGRKHFSLTKKGVGLFSNFEFYYGNPNTNGVMILPFCGHTSGTVFFNH